MFLRLFSVIFLFCLVSSKLNGQNSNICCGYNLDETIIENVSLVGWSRDIFSKFEELLDSEGYKLNIIKADGFSAMSGRIIIQKIEHEKVSLATLLKEVCSSGKWTYSVQPSAVIVGRKPFKEDEAKQKLLTKLFDNIIVPRLNLPYLPKEKAEQNRNDNGFTKFQYYFKYLEAVSRKYSPDKKGVKFKTVYDEDKGTGWLYGIYQQLPYCDLKNIPLGDFIYYMCQSSGLKYDVDNTGLVTIHELEKAKSVRTDEYTRCKSLFTIGRQFKENKFNMDNLYVKVELLKNGDKNQAKEIDRSFYKFYLNSWGYPNCDEFKRNDIRAWKINPQLDVGLNKAKVVFIKNHLPDYNEKDLIQVTFFSSFEEFKENVAVVSFKISDWCYYPFIFTVDEKESEL